MIKLKKNIDDKIDYRVVDTMRHNIKDIEQLINNEMNKAGYILGFQWTILFITSMKLNVWNVYIKLFILAFFVLGAFLSLLAISWIKWIFKIDVTNRYEFSRKEALEKMNQDFLILKDIYLKKVSLNNLNMKVQVVWLLFVLIVILFFS